MGYPKQDGVPPHRPIPLIQYHRDNKKAINHFSLTHKYMTKDFPALKCNKKRKYFFFGCRRFSAQQQLFFLKALTSFKLVKIVFLFAQMVKSVVKKSGLFFWFFFTAELSHFLSTNLAVFGRTAVDSKTSVFFACGAIRFSVFLIFPNFPPAAS